MRGRGANDAITLSPTDFDLPQDEDLVASARADLRDFLSDSETTQRAFNYLHDLVKGRYKKCEFIADDGSADRSGAEHCLAGLLYGVFSRYGEPDKAAALIRAYISHACRKNPATDDGQPRKWLVRGSKYHRQTVKAAIVGFDREVWLRWSRKQDQPHVWTDDYSDRTYEVVLDAVAALSGPEDYPTKREILDFAEKMDPTRSKRTHETALHRLRDEYEQVKMAHLGGNEYVYYPAFESDPADAKSVKVGGITDES